MQVQTIQPEINFYGKKRHFIELESHEQLRDILIKMDNETEYKSNDYSFESQRTKCLTMNYDGRNIELVDTRKSLTKIPEKYQMQGETLLTIGKSELVIDNKSGEIIDCYKPFFTTWNKLIKRVNDALIVFNASFYNSKMVNKKTLGISGFTQKGFEILKKIKVK